MKLDPFKNIILLSSELDPQASEERVEHRAPGVSNPLPDSVMGAWNWAPKPEKTGYCS